MRTKRLVRAMFFTVIALILTLIGGTALACANSDESTPAGPEGGEYYYLDAAGKESLITLSDNNSFTFLLGDEEREGTYALAGTTLTLTFNVGKGQEPETVQATVKGDYNSLSFTYREVSYTFLRKTTFTVSYDTSGAGSVPDEPVLNGMKASQPADPEKASYLFVGWYTEAGFKNKYSFDTPVTSDIKLYARFVSAIPEDPEFKVSFEPGEGAEKIEPVTTLRGAVYKLPEPKKENDTFVGWWVSATNSADKLSYRYEENRLYENTTLFAVWESDLDGAPAVSVNGEGISWTGEGNNFELSISAPGGGSFTRKLDTNSFAFEASTYAPSAEGEYAVTVSLDGKSTTVYYYHKLLARVSVFKVENGILSFNKVEGATAYSVSVDCGDEVHTAQAVDGSNAAIAYYDFTACNMKPEGITFKVTASAAGYLSSTSDPFNFEQTLGDVKDLAVDGNTLILGWSEVEGATSYTLSILSGDETVFNGNVVERSYALKNLDPATLKISVTANAHGWNPSAAASITYEKTKLASPSDFRLAGSTLTWKASAGAKGYDLTINGEPYSAESNSFELTEDFHKEGGTEITVVARAEDPANNSLSSDLYKVTDGVMGELSYKAGKLSWDPVFGATEYEVKVNEGPVQKVTETSVDVKLTAKHNTLAVRIADTEEWKEISVDAFEISFDLSYQIDPPAPIYKAVGDPISLEDEVPVERFGYEFDGWYYGVEKYTLSVFSGEEDIKLTARWNAHMHTITFVVGNESDEHPKALQVAYGTAADAYFAATPASNRDGYAFEGWYTGAYGIGDRFFDYQGKATLPYNRDSDLVLYANYVSVIRFEAENNNTEWRVSKDPENIGLVTEITIPAYYQNRPVTVISDFSDCLTLTKLRIPATIKDINFGETASAFSGCRNLKAVEVYEVLGYNQTPAFYSEGGVLFKQNASQDEKTLFFFPNALLYETEEYTIPSGVTEIGIAAFFNKPTTAGEENLEMNKFIYANDMKYVLAKINIPASVSYIRNRAFFNINSLKTIDFLPAQEGEKAASSLTIAKYAFYNTSTSGITELKLPASLNSVSMSDSTTLMDILSMFRNLTKIEVDENNRTFSAKEGILYRNYTEGSGLELVFFPRGNRDTTFTVPNGVYSIGAAAFKNFTYLQEVTIPGHVTNIAEEAFAGCTNLAKITFLGDENDQDLTIGEKAFYGYRSVYNSGQQTTSTNRKMTDALQLPANLKSLGNMAFARYELVTEVYVNTKGRESVSYAAGAFVDSAHNNLAYITTVHIGKDVPSFSVAAVFGSKLQEVRVAEGSTAFYSDEKGVLYNAEMTELLFFPAVWDGDYEIPEKVTTIADNLFAGRTGLSGIILHGGITSIGKGAFKNCTDLASVTFKERTADLTIGANAFEGCKGLLEIDLPERLTFIGKEAFKDCKGLTSIKIPASVKEMELGSSSSLDPDGVFYIFNGCTNLSSITIAEGSEYYKSIEGVLYSLRAVKGADGSTEYVADTLLYCPANILTEVKVPSSVRTVASYAFSGAHASKVTFEDLKETENVIREGQSEEDLVADSATLTLDKYAFGNYNALGHSYVKEIRFPAGLTTFGECSVYNCDSLTKFNIPNTVTSIVDHAFDGLGALTELVFDEGGTSGLRIEDTAGGSGSYGDTVYNGLFSSMKNLASITFPARLTYLGAYVFLGQGSHSTATYYIQNVTFTDSKGQFELEIGHHAFYNIKSLKTVTFAEGLTTIGERAFYQAGITSVSFPKSLKTISNSAFAYCNSLTAIEFAAEGKLTEIQDASTSSSGTFYHTAVQTVTLPASLEKLGSYAFSDCTKLTTVTLPADNHLATFGGNVFSGCTSFREFNFGKSADGVELTFGASAFANSVLTTFTFPANTAEIGDNAFSGSKLATVNFDVDPSTKVSKLTKIGSGAFQKTALATITFPDTANNSLSLGANLFKGCKYLTQVNLSKSVSEINGTFNGCGSLETITIADGNPYFSADKEQPIIYDANESIMLIYANVDGTFTIAPGATVIGQSAFANLTGLTKVVIPASVTSIGAYAFENCINLTTIEIATNGSALTTIGKGAFHNCKSLTSLNLEAASMLTTIESTYTINASNGSISGPAATVGGLFQGCVSLDTVKFPANLEFTDIYNTFKNWQGTTSSYLFQKSDVKNYDFSLCTKVTAFGKYAFANSAVESVILPANFEHFGTYCFDGCADLSRITAKADGLATLEEGTIDLSGLAQMKYMYDRPEKDFSSSFNVNTSTSSNYTFRDCTSIKKVILPPNLIFLGSYTFQHCTQLATVEGLENVIGLASSYIFNDTAITSATIGGEVTKLGGSIFQDCTQLSQITFENPGNITSLGSGLFQNCKSLTSFNFSQFSGLTSGSGKTTNPLYNANIFRGSGLTSADLTSFTEMTTIPNYTFADCADLEEVWLPNSITYLGTNTFQNCTSLSKINSEEEGTFDLSKLSLKLIGKSATAGLTSDKVYTFDGCASVQKVVLPDTCTKLAGWVFNNCTSLTEINLDKVTQIGNYCFSNTGFERIVLTSTVTSFGEGAFMYCENLTELVLRGFASISGKWLFAECPNLESVVVPTTLTHLGTYTFQNDERLSRIVSSNETDDAALKAAILLTSVGTFDFSNCTKLTRFSSGATTAVTSSTDSYIFAGCLSLKEVKLPSGFVMVGGFAFDGCEKLATFDFENLTNIGRNAFRGTALTSITLGSKLSVNVFYPFDDCASLKEVTLAEGNAAVELKDGALVDIKNGKILAALPNVVLNDEANGTLTLPETIKTLADYAFYGMGGVTKVDLSKTKITQIPQYAFYGSSVEEVVLPESVTTIGNYAFQNSAFKTMNFPAALTKLGNYVFSGSAVENMEIPNTVTSIGYGIFYLCEDLQTVTFANAAEDGSSAALTISAGNSGVPKDPSQSENRGALEYSSVRTVNLGDRIPEIPIRMFAYTTNLKSFTIPGNVTYIKRGTFYGSGITNIEIPGTVLKIDQEAFQTSKLQSITFKEGEEPLSSSMFNLFQGCTDLTDVDLGNRFTTLYYSSFADCTALETLVIPEGVVEINGAFTNCTSLSSLTLPESLERLLDTRNPFENTPKLKEIVIPEGVTQINKSVFYGMTKEQTVYFRGSSFTTAQLCGLDWMFNSEANFVFDYSGSKPEEEAPAESAAPEAVEALDPKKYAA